MAQDAYILALLLKTAIERQIPIGQVTGVFDRVRRPFISKVHAAVRRNAKIYEFLVPEYADVADTAESSSYYFRDFGTKVANDWQYAWSRLTDDDWEDIVSKLDEVADG